MLRFFYFFQKRCLKLICPLGSAAYFGKCQKIAAHIYNLNVGVYYRLQEVGVSNISLEDYNQYGNKTLQNVIDMALHELYGGGDFRCEACSSVLRQVVDHDGHNNEYILQYTFPISDNCQLDELLEHTTKPFGKELIIVLNSTLSLKYTISIESRSLHKIRVYNTLYNDGQYWCYATALKQSGLICPAVRINSSDLGTNLKLLQSAAEIDNGDTNNTLIEICWDDYKRVSSASNCHQIHGQSGCMFSVLLYYILSHNQMYGKSVDVRFL